MEYIRATKELQKNRLYKEYKELTHQYYLHSIKQEEKTNNYLKKKSIKNKRTGEVYSLSYDFETAQRKAKNEMLQRIIHLEQISRDTGLKPLFLTFTLPTKYHAFVSIGTEKKKRLYVDTNKNFLYRTISNSIKAGYEHLNHLFRVFYRQIKRYDFGRLIKFIKVYEPHSNLQCHLHALFFIHPKDIEKVILYFSKFLEKQDIGRSELDSKIVSNINHVGSYIAKYIYKNASDDNDLYFTRFLDGWKKKNKIRMVSTSNLQINMLLYKKLYTSIPKDLKKEMIQISSYNQQTLLTTLLERTEFNERTIKHGTSSKTTKIKNKKSHFIIKYDKVITKKIAQSVSKVKEKTWRVYSEEELYKDDNFVEEEFFFHPEVSDKCYSYLGYIVHQNIYEEIIETTAIKNITIYYKNKLLYKQSDFTLMYN